MQNTRTQIIVEFPKTRGGVYAAFNLIEKKVYVGETSDLYRRMCEHIRSMFGLEDSSNKNMLKEDCKTFELFTVKEATYDKSNSDETISEWIFHETIYLYLFRKNGFALYNGNEELKDNLGNERDFLYDKEITLKEMKDKLHSYLLSKDNLEDYIETEENELNQRIKERFDCTLQELAEANYKKREEIWKDRLKKAGADTKLELDTDSSKTIRKVYSICRKLARVHLKKNDMASCGLKKITIDDLVKLIEGNEMNRIAFCKFGHYLDQGPTTILKTKICDINNNKLKNLEGLDINPDRGDNGICFWALKRLNEVTTKIFLSDNGKHKEPRYVIMPYTPSKVYASSADSEKATKDKYQAILNPMDGESLGDFYNRMRQELDKIYTNEPANIAQDMFALGYACDKKNIQNKRGLKYSYPADMFPEVISKYSTTGRNSSSVAFLISELSYIDATFKDIKEIYKFFRSAAGADLESTFSGINSKCLAELKEDKKQSLINYLRDPENHRDTDETSFLIARIEYPYMVALANNKVEPN